ncbi:MAG: class I tRNA ligase family protein, partial [Desulfobacteraceae bacterium]
MKPVPSSVFFPGMEEEILKYWKEEGIFNQSLEKNKGKESYIFYDGPPFATGTPHYGHILTSYIKDTIPRYFTMKGLFVDRRWGWDCHGLPIEYEIEKKLNISGKKAIEDFGIDRFNKACADIVFKYAKTWEEVIERIGRWVDFSRQYRTMDLSYMESVMWVFKTLYDKGLIYESLKVVPYCNRCQTPLSNFETGLDDAYRMRDDPAIVAAFRDTQDSSISYLAWTTTPWTLPSNLALAVNPELWYCIVETDAWGKVVLAEARLEAYSKQLKNVNVVNRIKGKDLVGNSYTPLFDFALDPDDRNRFTILSGDFVDAQSGTGIVHIAPAFGEEDFSLCNDMGIKIFNPVGPDGCFTDEAGFLARTDVFKANPEIISHLKKSGQLMSRENYRHSYPHCWRCDNPLIYKAISSWYVKVTAFKETMCRANRNINWIPSHIKDGRFGKWLEDARDWAISRNRFWGSPIPVWQCDKCNARFVPESLTELALVSGQNIP